MKRFECDENHAQKFILRSDHERAGFHKFFFDRDWEDLSLYDLAINTGSFSPQTTAGMIKGVIDTEEFRAARDEAEMMLADLSLGHHIKTAIFFEERIPIQFFEIIVKKGVVTLRGIVV